MKIVRPLLQDARRAAALDCAAGGIAILLLTGNEPTVMFSLMVKVKLTGDNIQRVASLSRSAHQLGHAAPMIVCGVMGDRQPRIFKARLA